MILFYAKQTKSPKQAASGVFFHYEMFIFTSKMLVKRI